MKILTLYLADNRPEVEACDHDEFEKVLNYIKSRGPFVECGGLTISRDATIPDIDRVMVFIP